MALRVSATMALCLVFSLMAVAHCVVPLEAGLATDASATGTPVAEVDAAVPDEEGLLSLPSADDSVVPDVVPVEEEKEAKPVAEPDPDRSHPDIEEDEKKTKKNHDGDCKEEKKRKKHRDGDDKMGKKEKKKLKKHHEISSDGEEEEEKAKKKIHRHRHGEDYKMKKRPHHNKRSNDEDDSDDEDEVEEKAKRWRKAVSRSSMFGHGRRSQREESQTQEVKN